MSTVLRHGSFSRHTWKINNCIALIRIIITFRNQTFLLSIFQSFEKYEFESIWRNAKARFYQISTFFPCFLFFLNRAEFSKMRLINGKWNIICSHVLIIFQRTFIFDCYSTAIKKTPIIWFKIVNFFKFVSEPQQRVRKLSQKNSSDVFVHFISLSIYQLDFRKFCPIQKEQKMLVFAENNSWNFSKYSQTHIWRNFHQISKTNT